MKQNPDNEPWWTKVVDGALDAFDWIELLGEGLHLGGRMIAAILEVFIHLLDGL